MSEMVLEVRVQSADQPEWENEQYLALASDVAERFPDLARIVTDPMFSSLQYTIDLTTVKICCSELQPAWEPGEYEKWRDA